MKIGFYWVRFKDSKDRKWTIGYYEGEFYNDGSPMNYPWQVVGSDEIYTQNEVEVGSKIEEVM